MMIRTFPHVNLVGVNKCTHDHYRSSITSSTKLLSFAKHNISTYYYCLDDQLKPIRVSTWHGFPEHCIGLHPPLTAKVED